MQFFVPVFKLFVKHYFSLDDKIRSVTERDKLNHQVHNNIILSQDVCRR